MALTTATERRLLQVAVGLACLVPLLAGGIGVLRGAAFLRAAPLVDLDSHVRYLSGLLLAIGVGFAASIPAIEQHGARMRTLGLLVVTGGLARLLSLYHDGLPSAGHRFGLVMELIIVPALLLWQARVAQRVGAAPSTTIVGR
ncbi:hypothetical protein GGR88_001715 [Sphingomonas jejuensis]|uniref:DUF4345 domain-containing protein n=1 Tax=Sphingomonas jejuensis TaxID=904715 RepID=A0ABX0XLJ5_9SPHN|nr:DUF4345 domain-containing protein [Sphingomonas jejuensis]NJC34241.1 hypothetical protein [Sphingomonas jejuensis]